MSLNLLCQYGSLKLRTPLIVGACPLTMDRPMRIAMESAGAAAIVLPTLFEEQIVSANTRTLTAQGNRRFLHNSNSPHFNPSFHDAQHCLTTLRAANEDTSVPIIAILGGQNSGDWLNFAARLAEAGASAIELNVYPPAEEEFASPEERENELVEIASRISQAISIPLFVKLDRHHTSISHLARRLLSGVDGVTLFAKFPVTDIRLDRPEVELRWDLTAPDSITDLLGPVMEVHANCPSLALCMRRN
ncbi:MAG: dihydroorotate dehydrogenase [Pirellulaceae bacterium]